MVGVTKDQENLSVAYDYNEVGAVDTVTYGSKGVSDSEATMTKYTYNDNYEVTSATYYNGETPIELDSYVYPSKIENGSKLGMSLIF